MIKIFSLKSIQADKYFTEFSKTSATITCTQISEFLLSFLVTVQRSDRCCQEIMASIKECVTGNGHTLLTNFKKSKKIAPHYHLFFRCKL